MLDKIIRPCNTLFIEGDNQSLGFTNWPNTRLALSILGTKRTPQRRMWSKGDKLSPLGEKQMTKHTEGPWKVEKYSDQNVRDAERIRSADGLIVVPEVWGNSLDSCDANYCLIAAAPELLEAVKRAREVLAFPYINDARHQADFIAVLDAAISKAEGR
jgi:hypothetical protein